MMTSNFFKLHCSARSWIQALTEVDRDLHVNSRREDSYVLRVIYCRFYRADCGPRDGRIPAACALPMDRRRGSRDDRAWDSDRSYDHAAEGHIAIATAQ